MLVNRFNPTACLILTVKRDISDRSGACINRIESTQIEALLVHVVLLNGLCLRLVRPFGANVLPGVPPSPDATQGTCGGLGAYPNVG